MSMFAYILYVVLKNVFKVTNTLMSKRASYSTDKARRTVNTSQHKSLEA